MKRLIPVLACLLLTRAAAAAPGVSLPDPVQNTTPMPEATLTQLTPVPLAEAVLQDDAPVSLPDPLNGQIHAVAP